MRWCVGAVWVWRGWWCCLGSEYICCGMAKESRQTQTLLFMQDKLAYVQVVTDCGYSIVQMCTWAECSPAFLYDVMSQSERHNTCNLETVLM